MKDTQQVKNHPEICSTPEGVQPSELDLAMAEILYALMARQLPS